MSQEFNLPENVVQFLDSYIDSVEQLQVLLLLHSEPNRTWTLKEITTELRSTETSIEKRLDDLYERKILQKGEEQKDRHSFMTSDVDMQTTIQDLAEQFQIRSYKIIEAIYSRPAKNLLSFADAFRLKGDKK